jgi:hypothetical protein
MYTGFYWYKNNLIYKTMEYLKVEVTLLNSNTKELFKTNIETLKSDFYLQRYCEVQKTFLSENINIDWIVYLCNLQQIKDLNNFELNSYQIK